MSSQKIPFHPVFHNSLTSKHTYSKCYSNHNNIFHKPPLHGKSFNQTQKKDRRKNLQMSLYNLRDKDTLFPLNTAYGTPETIFLHLW